MHYQNQPDWAGYVGALEEGRLPLHRAHRPTAHQALIREVILQLKRGTLDLDYFQNKFGVDVAAEWAHQWQQHADDGMLVLSPGRVELTRQGLLHADALLTAFFEPEHQGIRYT